MSIPLPLPPRPDLDFAPDPGRPKASWSWYVAVGVYLIAFVLGALATVPVLAAFGQLGKPSEGSGVDAAGAWATIVADVVITGVLVFWLATWHKRWRESVGLSEPGKRLWNWLWGYGVGLVLYPVVALGVGVILTLLFQAVSGHQVRSPDQVASHLSASGVVAVVLLSLVIAPISEEFFFRGALVPLRSGIDTGSGSARSARPSPSGSSTTCRTFRCATPCSFRPRWSSPGSGSHGSTNDAGRSSPTSARTWPSTRSGSS